MLIAIDDTEWTKGLIENDIIKSTEGRKIFSKAKNKKEIKSKEQTSEEVYGILSPVDFYKLGKLLGVDTKSMRWWLWWRFCYLWKL